jgi:hypothetical protein
VRDLRALDRYRVHGHDRHGGLGCASGGSFMIRCKSSTKTVRVVASNGYGWDHVSVSLPSRCPTWEEMDEVKRLFFRDDEVAMQIHVAVNDHINIHPYVLHLWRPHEAVIPLPPKILV